MNHHDCKPSSAAAPIAASTALVGDVASLLHVSPGRTMVAWMIHWMCTFTAVVVGHCVYSYCGATTLAFALTPGLHYTVHTVRPDHLIGACVLMFATVVAAFCAVRFLALLFSWCKSMLFGAFAISVGLVFVLLLATNAGAIQNTLTVVLQTLAVATQPPPQPQQPQQQLISSLWSSVTSLFGNKYTEL